MSLKRYAIIAAVSYHNNHHNPSTTVASTMSEPFPPRQHHNGKKAQKMAPALFDPSASTTQSPPTALLSSQDTDREDSTVQSNNNAIGTTYYAGGLGVFHQQNIRANSWGSGNSFISNSANSGSGNSYPNTVNGNVNLLLGGAMLSLVTTILCVVCYCCHRNIKKRTEAAYRQQRQWLENDPNMEIYSVEQCYETSGLFLGESMDGLSTMPALHHEPPPSYDAVVAMQEQQLQQQQLIMQQHQLHHNSPPPGYRSSLDVSILAATAACSASDATVCSRGIPDGMATCDSNGNLQQKLVTTNKQQQILNMEKVLNAQSCCSLQRAEAENMWNAATAGVNARTIANAGILNEQATGTWATNANMPTPTMMSTRKSVPGYTSGKLRVNAIGRRYLNQNYYRRGCPLCGKFCYEVEDTLSLSTESGLDNAVLAATANGNCEVVSSSCSACHATSNLETMTDENQNVAMHVDEGEDAESTSLTAAVQPATGARWAEDDANGNTEICELQAIPVATENSGHCTTSFDEQPTTSAQATAGVDLDTISENSIVRLDMSKIIDKTGLPTYEAALKLESSGYV